MMIVTMRSCSKTVLRQLANICGNLAIMKYEADAPADYLAGTLMRPVGRRLSLNSARKFFTSASNRSTTAGWSFRRLNFS
ncbi:MAG: hypothetical protein ACPGVU_23860, partial [Limisphaerales bacterium]